MCVIVKFILPVNHLLLNLQMSDGHSPGDGRSDDDYPGKYHIASWRSCGCIIIISQNC